MNIPRHDRPATLALASPDILNGCYTDKLAKSRCTKPDRREFIKISQAVGKYHTILGYVNSYI